MKITIGRTVLYVLNKEDVRQIDQRRTDGSSIGNTVKVGDTCPAVAIRVWSQSAYPPVNLQVFLDGNDTYWATSRTENPAKTPGTWHWPERA